ncbi:AMP-binding protein [Nocardia bovistercoris]|nr:AMP-binding protein [Nocardia bovistercoris]
MLLVTSAIRYPHRLAVVDDRGLLTYSELRRRVDSIAAALYATAPTAPRSIAILCRNHRGFVEAMAAGARLGAELVFVNTELPAAQLDAILRRHRPDVLIHDEEYADAVRDTGFAGLRVLAWHESGTGDLTLDGLAARSGRRPPPVRRPVRVTLLTSGTTGLAKGVPKAMKPRAIALLCVTAMGTIRLRRRDTVAAATPFFHGFGLVALLGPLALGSTVVCRRRFDAGQTLDDITRHRVTVLMAVPVMLQRILALDDLDPAPARRSLRVIVTGAAPITPITVSRVVEAFGPILVNGYGSTEAGLVTIARPEDLAAAPDTAGYPALGVSVRVLRADRSPADIGETGRIFVRTGLDYAGYTPETTGAVAAKNVVDGHVDTGDMGHFDARGRLTIDGRSDDMIVSGGENVFPGEVEARLTTHPEVADAAVIGVGNPEFGQVLHAFVVPAGNAAPSEADLRRHLRAGLERYKVPKRFTVVAEIPRNAGGKVAKAALRASTVDPHA